MGKLEEWVTIAEAAKRAGVSERTARRYAAKMDSGAVKRSGRTGRLVRLSEFVTAMAGSFEINTVRSENTATVIVASTDTMATDSADTVDRESIPDSRLIEQYERRLADKDAEIAFLRAASDTHAQEIERRDIAEGELRRLLLADREEIRRLRSQLALPEGPATADPEESSLRDAVGGPVPSDTANYPQEPDKAAGKSTEKPRRGWIAAIVDTLREAFQ